ncbi:MAG: hypothetical protein Q7W54_16920 [Bacteroidota bacterium]|nr:hypothetical protein [Bacteroidota bacterium]
MRITELINEIKRLPLQKRIFLIEKTLHSIRQEEEINQMKKAVDLLLKDYKTDSELTAFKDIDYEEFYEAR